MTNATSPQATHEATLVTSLGNINLVLYGNHAPITVKNFVELATGKRPWKHPVTGVESTDPLYDDTIFHRVIPDFMIQAGDPEGTGMGGPGYRFDDEIHPELNFNEPHMLAMANAGRRGGKGTNGSQFFVTTAPTSWLQGKHTIFGRVSDAESAALADRISQVKRNQSDRPLEDVILKQIEVRPL